MADKTKTLYRLPDGEPVAFEAGHAKRLLALEKQLGFNNFTDHKPTPADAAKQSTSHSDSDKTGAGAPDGAETGTAG